MEKPEPGSCCPTCERRVPHPKKDSTPESRVISYRVPADEADSFVEILQVAAKIVGAHELPYWQWRTFNAALVRLLQDGVKVY